jgi:hypothetical protein
VAAAAVRPRGQFDGRLAPSILAEHRHADFIDVAVMPICTSEASKPSAAGAVCRRDPYFADEPERRASANAVSIPAPCRSSEEGRRQHIGERQVSGFEIAGDLAVRPNARLLSQPRSAGATVDHRGNTLAAITFDLGIEHQDAGWPRGLSNPVTAMKQRHVGAPRRGLAVSVRRSPPAPMRPSKSKRAP